MERVYAWLRSQDVSSSSPSSSLGNPRLENNVVIDHYGYSHNTMNHHHHHHPTLSLASLGSQFQRMGINGTESVQNVGISNNRILGTLANYHEIPRRGFNVFRRSLEDVNYGNINIVTSAKDTRGSRFLIKKLHKIRNNPQEIEHIFLQVKDDLHDLMMDSNGSRFLIKLFEVISETHMNVILDLILISFFFFFSNRS